MKKKLLILIMSISSISFGQTVSNGYYVFGSAIISGENDVVFQFHEALADQWGVIQPQLSGLGINNTQITDLVETSYGVTLWKGDGTGSPITIGVNVADPYDGVGDVPAWSFGNVFVKNITEFVKVYFPNLIGSNGAYRIRMKVNLDKNLNQQGAVVAEAELIVLTDAKFILNDIYTCENHTVDVHSYLQPIWLPNQPTIYTASNTCTSGGGMSGNFYNVGNIVDDAINGCNITITATNSNSIINNTNSEWWFLNNIRLSNGVSTFSPNYNTSPGPSEYNGWLNKVVNYIDTATMFVSNNPVITFNSFPSPLYNNAPDLVLENYISILYQDNYSISGPGVTFNTAGNNHLCDVSLPEGTYNIDVIATRGECTKLATTPIDILKWPGTPPTPTLNWLTSFDQPTDSAYYVPGGPLMPCQDNGVTIDCNYWWRHKWLCPRRDLSNTTNDTLTLEINSPVSGYIYEWKIEINGFEQFIGTGTSKAIQRRYYPLNNGLNTYKEKIYFRAQNTVGLWSAWEFVTLEYPIFQTQHMYNAGDSLYPDKTQYKYLCHDGSIPNQYDNPNFSINEVYKHGLGASYWNTNLSLVGNKYSTYITRDNTANQNEGDSWYEGWAGNKHQVNYFIETAQIKRNIPAQYVNYDYCKCDTRNYEIHSVKKPEIVNIFILDDTLNIQEIASMSMTTVWDGIGNWYIDSNVNSQLPYVGNNINYVVNGSTGWHNMYVQAVDTFGCFSDSMLLNFYYVNSFTIDGSIVDTVIYVPNGSGVGISAEFGGNLIVTPNDDGKNDQINILDINGREYEFVLFDRWGNIVLKVSDNVNTINVNEMKSSTYYYSLEIEGINNKGFVEIKR